jgi:hypothetical protein
MGKLKHKLGRKAFAKGFDVAYGKMGKDRQKAVLDLFRMAQKYINKTEVKVDFKKGEDWIMNLTEGYILEEGLDENNNIIGYKFVNLGKLMDFIKDGLDGKEAIEKASGTYGRFDEAVKKIDPRRE